jgi:hypothetical protein
MNLHANVCMYVHIVVTSRRADVEFYLFISTGIMAHEFVLPQPE